MPKKLQKKKEKKRPRSSLMSFVILIPAFLSDYEMSLSYCLGFKK